MGSRRSKDTCERVAAKLTADAATATQMLADAEREASPPTRVTGACSTTIRTSGSRRRLEQPATRAVPRARSRARRSQSRARARRRSHRRTRSHRRRRAALTRSGASYAAGSATHPISRHPAGAAQRLPDGDMHRRRRPARRPATPMAASVYRYPCLVGAGLRGTEVGSAAHAQKRPENPSRSREIRLDPALPRRVNLGSDGVRSSSRSRKWR